MDQAPDQKEIICTIIESPYAGDVELNVGYLQAAMRDSLLRGEAPYASHGLYTQPGVLRDEIPGERELGMRAGFAWRDYAARTVFYIDQGFSSGMNRALLDCLSNGYPLEFRSLWNGCSYQKREYEHTSSTSTTQRTQAA